MKVFILFSVLVEFVTCVSLYFMVQQLEFPVSEISPLFSFLCDNISLIAIETAEKFLNIPTWSRGHERCFSPKSEINCRQLYLAYLTLKKWEMDRNSSLVSKNEFNVVLYRPRCGFGNSIYHGVTAILLATALNRTIFVSNMLDGVIFPKSLYLDGSIKEKIKRTYGRWPIKNYEHWQRKTAEQLRIADAHIVATYCYPYFLLMEPTFSQYILSHFGIHFVYFTANYLAKTPQKIEDVVFDIFKPIPYSVKIIGVHIRHHRGRSNMFVKNKNELKKKVFPFLDNFVKNRQNYIALATDSGDIVKLVASKYRELGKRLIIANVQRKPDGKKDSAATDIALLMMCHQMIGTYRSSFSSIISHRAMLTPYYISNEVPSVFQYTSSQMGIPSGIFERNDYNYVFNFRAKLFNNTESAAKVFFNIMWL